VVIVCSARAEMRARARADMRAHVRRDRRQRLGWVEVTPSHRIAAPHFSRANCTNGSRLGLGATSCRPVGA